MRTSHVRKVLALAVALCPWPAAATAQTSYAAMAPLDQYLMTDRQAEVALARTAAPTAITEHAQVLVMARNGYEVAEPGTNGFVCLVERSWNSPFEHPNFWNPHIRGPICYNPAAARSVLPLIVRRARLVLSGMDKARLLRTLRAGAHHAAAPGAMSYMLSKDGFLDDVAGHWRPHLMFYAPLADSSRWGADLAGVEVYGQRQFAETRDPIAVFIVPVAKWSDGSAVEAGHSN